MTPLAWVMTVLLVIGALPFAWFTVAPVARAANRRRRIGRTALARIGQLEHDLADPALPLAWPLDMTWHPVKHCPVCRAAGKVRPTRVETKVAPLVVDVAAGETFTPSCSRCAWQTVSHEGGSGVRWVRRACTVHQQVPAEDRVFATGTRATARGVTFTYTEHAVK